jgi:hypothetical protein
MIFHQLANQQPEKEKEVLQCLLYRVVLLHEDVQMIFHQLANQQPEKEKEVLQCLLYRVVILHEDVQSRQLPAEVSLTCSQDKLPQTNIHPGHSQLDMNPLQLGLCLHNLHSGQPDRQELKDDRIQETESQESCTRTDPESFHDNGGDQKRTLSPPLGASAKRIKAPKLKIFAEPSQPPCWKGLEMEISRAADSESIVYYKTKCVHHGQLPQHVQDTKQPSHQNTVQTKEGGRISQLNHQNLSQPEKNKFEKKMSKIEEKQKSPHLGRDLDHHTVQISASSSQVCIVRPKKVYEDHLLTKWSSTLYYSETLDIMDIIEQRSVGVFSLKISVCKKIIKKTRN